MKKLITVLLFLLVLAGIMTGCGNFGKSQNEDTLNIVTTIFPEYDWVRQILGDGNEQAQITLLLDNGVDLHSYQPNADDLVAISNCDMFIYIGGHSDSWVEDALANRVNQDMVVINLLDVLGDAVKSEEIVEGMEHDHAHEDEHTGEEHDHGHEAEIDEHIWLSLRNAKTIVSYIACQLGAVDPDNASVYTENANAYMAELDALDGEYQAVVEGAALDTLLFADRFPFRYLVDDYGIEYYAAFSGCSAESEASFETVAFLAGKVDTLGLSHVLTIENATHKIAQTVIDNTESKDQTVLVLNSLQSVTAKDVGNGLTYLDVMRENLEVLKDALN